MNRVCVWDAQEMQFYALNLSAFVGGVKFLTFQLQISIYVEKSMKQSGKRNTHTFHEKSFDFTVCVVIVFFFGDFFPYYSFQFRQKETIVFCTRKQFYFYIMHIICCALVVFFIHLQNRSVCMSLSRAIFHMCSVCRAALLLKRINKDFWKSEQNSNKKPSKQSSREIHSTYECKQQMTTWYS